MGALDALSAPCPRTWAPCARARFAPVDTPARSTVPLSRLCGQRGFWKASLSSAANVWTPPRIRAHRCARQYQLLSQTGRRREVVELGRSRTHLVDSGISACARPAIEKARRPCASRSTMRRAGWRACALAVWDWIVRCARARCARARLAIANRPSDPASVALPSRGALHEPAWRLAGRDGLAAYRSLGCARRPPARGRARLVEITPLRVRRGVCAAARVPHADLPGQRDLAEYLPNPPPSLRYRKEHTASGAPRVSQIARTS